MVVGREQERRRIDAVLEEARAGRSGALLLEGESGIGKTALLDEAIDRAGGLRVLRAAGSEFESELAYATLHQLVRPVVELIDRLPAPQAHALRVAFAQEDGRAERFNVYAAVLGLLAAAAEEGPLLCVVDDCHWLDQSSGEALAFVARRLGTDGIALLLAARPGGSHPFAPPAVALLRVTGLDTAGAAALLAGGRRAAAPAFVTALVEATGGNPLALLELPPLLSDEQLAGTEPLGELLPVSDEVSRAFLDRTAALPEEARRALLVAAAGAGSPAHTVLAALAATGLGPGALDPAEAAGLVHLGPTAVEFRHPLLRSAIHAAAPAAERRLAHAGLAQALEAEGGDRRAWHLAAAATGPDERVAGELERVGANASRRGGVVAAARAFEEAARLSPDRSDRGRRLSAAADEWLRHGDVSRADELFGEALALADSAGLRLEIIERQGYLAVQRGEAEAAYARITRAAEEVEAGDGAAAAGALSTAGSLPLARLDAPELLRLSERIEELWGEKQAAARPKVLIRTARARILAGETQAGVDALLALAELCLTLPTTGAAAECAESLVWVEQTSLARRLLEHELHGARENGDHLLVAFALNPLALLELRCGRLVAAYGAALEAVGTAEEIGQPLQLAYNLAVLARVEAALGREEDCRAHAARALSLVDTDLHHDVQADVRAALGQLALALGNADEAIDELERLQAIVDEGRVREPGFAFPGAGDLIEAYARAGRHEDAERELARLEALADAAGRAGARALAARCRGIVASEDGYDACFEEALRLFAAPESPLERFRTELCYAERLRRSKRRTAARDRLRRALDTFDQLGETPWAVRARRELAAVGVRVARGEADADRLTPQELQVALAVAEGASNREVAGRLFLSPKTIEFHLGNVYRKLGIRSRRELIVLYAGQRSSESARL